jgi:3-hydroxyisobutyrate dehydrogenase-like beta-hydroxyacid dehydrogenase
MSTVAFLGLGAMGAPMAGRLLEAGHTLVVWNRTPARTEELAERGATVGGTPAEAVRDAEAVVTMVTDPSALEDVLFGEHGAAEGLRPGSTLIEMSTIGPEAFEAVAARAPDGVTVVDAPVLGSVAAAGSGGLTVLVGADPEVHRRILPILEVFGNVRLVGGPGAGAAMKLVLNSTLGAIMAALGEALALADGLGLDRATTLDVLEGSHLGAVVAGKRSMVESGSYPAQFRLALALKDLELVERAAERAGVRLEVARASLAQFRAAAEAGRGDEDYSALIGFLPELRR